MPTTSTAGELCSAAGAIHNQGFIHSPGVRVHDCGRLDGAGCERLSMTQFPPVPRRACGSAFVFSLNRPAALVAAIPAVLGFVPEKSLVIVTVDGGELGCVMRVDLSPDAYLAAGQVSTIAAAAEPDAAIAVIIDEEGAGCLSCNDEHRALSDSLGYALDEHGIELLAVHVVDRVAAGGRWHCVDLCGASGEIDDPAASPLAMAAVLDGRRLYARRTDLQRVIGVDRLRSARIAALLKEGPEMLDGDPGAADYVRATAPIRGEVEFAVAAALRMSDGDEPDDPAMVRLAWALRDKQVRDILFALAVGEDADAAEALWTLLSRCLPVPWRAEALVMLAFSAYSRGDGPLAGISLDAALRCAPMHRMGGMLDAALQSGMRPERIRELAFTAYRLADGLGIALPPPGGPGGRAG